MNQPADHSAASWWRRDVSSPEFKQRQAFALWVSVPILIGAFLFRVIAGWDYEMSFLPALAFGALGWVGLQARQQHRRRSL